MPEQPLERTTYGGDNEAVLRAWLLLPRVPFEIPVVTLPLLLLLPCRLVPGCLLTRDPACFAPH